LFLAAGTATIAHLAGGALEGGGVVSDWPALKDADLQPGLIPGRASTIRFTL